MTEGVFFQHLGTIFRYTFVSFIYGLLLLILPWLGIINERNIRSKDHALNCWKKILMNILARFRSFILFIGLISLLASLAQLIFQSILLANKPYGHTISTCMYQTKTLDSKSFDLLRYEHCANSSIFRSRTVSECRLPF